MIIFVLILCLSDVTIGRPQSGRPTSCMTVNGENGFCVPIISCDSLLQILKKSPLLPDDVNFLRRNQCDRNQRTNVCCPDKPSSPAKQEESGRPTSCMTVNGENGFCVPIISCDSLLQILKKSPLLPDDVNFLRRSQCDRNQRTNVCCPDKPSSPAKQEATRPHSTAQILTPVAHVVTPTSVPKTEARISARKCIEYKEFSFDKSYFKNSPGSLFEFRSSNCAVVTKTVILGGIQVTPREFPHMALIGYEIENRIEWLCGGSLISERFVLSAGNFISSAKYIRLGEHDISQANESLAIDITIMERIPHPEYRHSYNDIILFKLSRSVELNGAIRPICLPQEPVSATKDAIVSGWGYTNGTKHDQRSNVLLKVKLDIFSQNECNDKYSAYYIDLPNGIDERTQMCAGWMDGSTRKDSCKGDSGGPIQIVNQNPDDKCIYTILGVTSLGPVMCGIKGHPSVYTRVYPYLDWIEKIVWPDE